MANRRNLITFGCIAAGAFFLYPKAVPNGNPFETQGVKNVGDAFSAAGGTTTHTPGIATKRGGDSESNISAQEKMKGVGTPHFDEKYADQRMGEAGTVSKAFRGAHYGNEKGK